MNEYKKSQKYVWSLMTNTEMIAAGEMVISGAWVKRKNSEK